MLNVINEAEISKAVNVLSYLVEFGECDHCKIIHSSLFLMLANAIPRVDVSEKVRKKAEKDFQRLNIATYGRPVPPEVIGQEEFEQLFTTWKSMKDLCTAKAS